MGELDEKLNAILGNQEAMGQIMALAQSLGASGALGGQGNQDGAPTVQQDPSAPQAPPAAQTDPLFALGNLDPRLLQLGMRLMQEYQSGDDQKTALLSALRPFVKEERYAKLDRAIQIARLSRVIRVLFETMGKEGERHV